MKILFTGGGTGGHFYPIIAVAEELQRIAKEQGINNVKLFFMSVDPFDPSLLQKNNINFKYNTSGKIRRYFSIMNIVDFFKIIYGGITALLKVFIIYPDVIFSKGGYGSFPAVFAGRLLLIPVIIHESDSAPGRVNAWAGKFALKIAVSFPEAASYFKSEKTAVTGHPMHDALTEPNRSKDKIFFDLDPNLMTITVLGGSSGSLTINENIIDILPELLVKYQVIHQTGKKNYPSAKARVNIILGEQGSPKYKVFDYLDEGRMALALGAADLVISRAGSSAIFEIANVGVPSIIIPIPESISHDQKKNAISYAGSGAAVLLEEQNLTKNILLSEISRIIENEAEIKKMSSAAKDFYKPGAALKIAKEILNTALSHDSA